MLPRLLSNDGRIHMRHEITDEMEKAVAADYSNMAGIAVLKNGECVYEKYFGGCNQNSRLNVFSVTKSVVSILLGIALDKGFIGGINEKVLDFFPEYTPKRGEKTLRDVTLRDMLTMTAPYKYKTNPYTKYFTSSDWVRFSLDMLGGKGKIGDFRYAPLIGPDILTGILARTTGKSALDFARENLFDPLGIKVEGSITFNNKEEQMAFYKSSDMSVWVADRSGVNAGGWGLTLSPTDMAKIGQLYSDGGTWMGKRIVSEEWVSESTSEHSRWAERDLPYGYLWWILPEIHGFAAIGDGGNIIYVNRKENITVGIASHFKPAVKDRIGFIREFIEPAFC